jgi:Zn-dependent metalloprotease
MNSTHDLRFKGAFGDSSSHLRYEQIYSGVPVFGSGVSIQVTPEGKVKSVFADTLSSSKVFDKGLVSLTPTLSREDAELFAQVAIELKLDRTNLLAEAPATLVIYDPQLLNQIGSPLLAWEMTITSTVQVGIREKILIDAHTGDVALNYSLVHTAKNRTIYDAENTNADPGTFAINEASGPSSIADANDAFEYLGDTYDYFFINHNRDSLDDGFALKATVRFCEPGFECPMENAFWYNQKMYFGQGFAAADDVVGHELVHGLTEFTSELIYYSQSGAINESLSDIFGEFIDQGNGSGTDTPEVKWQMGEDVPGFGAIRNMQDPTLFGDPDRRCSVYYYDGLLDEQGVHINSGVINKLAYLLVDGDTFNGHTINAMGIPAVSDLFYYCEVNLLNRANLENACQAVEISTINSCITIPENDECNNAQEVFEGIQVEGTNRFSTDSGVSSCEGDDSSDVWFTYTPNLSGPYEISTFGSNFDTTLVVYDGCGGANLYCDDDTIGLSSQVDAVLTSGQPYLIRVAGFAGSVGDIVLSVEYDGVGGQITIPGMSFDMNTNPDWTTQGSWAYGSASGSQGNPASGTTGTKVYGYALSGKYTNNLSRQYLTTPAFDFSGYTNVTLSFMRFLGVQGNFLDNASIEVSNNGSTWSTVWKNGLLRYEDTAWAEEIVDISTVADNQPSVQIRWVMGETDGSDTFFGWNIDDVQIKGTAPLGLSEVWVDFAYLGTSTGIQAYPFKELSTGLDALTTDGSGVVKIKGDTAQSASPVTGEFSDALRIEAIGGTATLGAQE